MRFKVDENLPVEIAEDLRLAGHEGDTVTGEGLAGAPDFRILAAAQAEDRVLLTLDKGLADLRTHPPGRYAGIVLFRLRATGRRATREFVRSQLPKILGADPRGHLLVIGESGIRRR